MWKISIFIVFWRIYIKNSIFRYKRPKRAVGALRQPRPRVHAAFLHEQWANRPCGLMYRTIFFFTNSCEPQLAHRLQTSKMRRNSTSLDSCQHEDINIVTVSVARRRWTAPLKPWRSCVKHFTTFYALLKHVSPNGDYFTPKGHFSRPRASFLRTGARRGHFRCL